MADAAPLMTRFHGVLPANVASWRNAGSLSSTRSIHCASITVFTCNELFRIEKAKSANGGQGNEGAKKTPAETGEG